jgi:hypothetical protein
MSEEVTDPSFRNAAVRLMNFILGAWLYVSVFIWPHTPAQAVNVALTGIFIALTALAAWSVGPEPRLRFINAALGLWLLTSIGAFPTRSTATIVNSAIVAVLVIVISLIPEVPIRHYRRPRLFRWST